MRKTRFGGLWEDVMKRDEFKCVRCGMTNEIHKQLFNTNLTIDHINGKGRHADKPDNRMENLQVLCLRCHGQKDSLIHGKWSKYIPIDYKALNSNNYLNNSD